MEEVEVVDVEDVEAVDVEDVVDMDMKVNIFLCVRFCENQPKSYISLLIGQNQLEKSNTYFKHIFNIVSGRHISVAQAKKWKDAWKSTTQPTLNPQWAKSFKSGNLVLWQTRYFQSTQVKVHVVICEFVKIGRVGYIRQNLSNFEGL